MYDGVLSSEGQSKSILGPTITLVSDSKLLTSRVKPAGYVRRGEEKETCTCTCTCVREHCTCKNKERKRRRGSGREGKGRERTKIHVRVHVEEI